MLESARNWDRQFLRCWAENKQQTRRRWIHLRLWIHHAVLTAPIRKGTPFEINQIQTATDELWSIKVRLCAPFHPLHAVAAAPAEEHVYDTFNANSDREMCDHRSGVKKDVDSRSSDTTLNSTTKALRW